MYGGRANVALSIQRYVKFSFNSFFWIKSMAFLQNLQCRLKYNTGFIDVFMVSFEVGTNAFVNHVCGHFVQALSNRLEVPPSFVFFRSLYLDNCNESL